MIDLFFAPVCKKPPKNASGYIAQLLRAPDSAKLLRLGKKISTARSLEQLKVGDRLILGKDAGVRLVYYGSRERFKVLAGSVITIGEHSPVAVSGTVIREKRAKGVLFRPFPSPRHSSPLGPDYTGQVMRVIPGKASAEGPQGALRPGERITVSYSLSVGRLELRSGDRRGPMVATDSLTGSGSWSSPPLSPDVYYWTIRDPAYPTLSGVIRILSDAELQAVLEALEESAEIPREGKSDPTPELCRAAILEGAGLFAEAKIEYQKVLKIAPGEATAKLWLDEYAGNRTKGK